MSTRGAKFLAAVRGVPGHHVTKVLTALTPGVNWINCSKRHIAEQFDSAERHGRGAVWPRLNDIDIDRLGRMARARMAGDVCWWGVK